MLMLTTTVGDDFFSMAEDDIQVEESAPSGGGEAAAAPADSGSSQEAVVSSAPSGDAPAADAAGTEASADQTSGDAAGQDQTGIAPAVAAAIETAGEVPAAEGQPTDGQSSEAQPTDPQPTDGQPADPQQSGNQTPENPTPENEADTPNTNTDQTTPTDNPGTDPTTIDPANPDPTIVVEDPNAIPEVDPENPEISDPENPDDPTEEDETGEITEEEQCEHKWKYTSNNDGTHIKLCSECNEESTENCSFDENGVCTLCGYVQETECQHEWEYISNEDGTHTKTCKLCGVSEIEECTYDADGICIYCGQVKEDEAYELIYTEISTTVDGVVITVKGEMPAGASLDAKSISISQAESILENTDASDFNVFKAFDINIIDQKGNYYQPQNDGNSLEITVKGIDEVAEVPDEQVEVIRVQDESSTTAETVSSTVSGTDVTFDADHFSYYFIGGTTSDSDLTVYSYQTLSTTGTIGADDSGNGQYVKVNSASFQVYIEAGDDFTCQAQVYRDITSTDSPMSGTAIGSVHTESISAEEVAAGGSGWYQVTFDFTSDSDPYMYTGTNYAVRFFSFGNDVSVKTDIGGASEAIFLDSTKQSKENAITVALSDGVTDPGDITGIRMTSSKYATQLVALSNVETDTSSSNYGYATNFAGDIYYLLGDTDTLSVELNPSRTRSITWSNSNTDVVSISGSGMTRSLTTKNPGTATITATYNSGITATLNVHVVQPLLNGSTVSTYESTATYKGVQYAPTPTLSEDGSASTYGSSYIGNVTYADNENAGTATVTIPFTISSSNSGKSTTFTYSVQFTISPAELNYTTFSSDSGFAIAIDIDDDTVTSVTHPLSGISAIDATYGLTMGESADYTISLSNKTYTTGGIQYTVTLAAGGSGNYTVSSTDYSGTYTYTVSNMNINDYAYVEWNDDATTYFTYTGSSIYAMTSDGNYITDQTALTTYWTTKPFTFYVLSSGSEATWITADTISAVTYSNNVDAGTASLKIGVSGYEGTLDLTYTIAKVNISQAYTTLTDENGGSTPGSYAHPAYTHKSDGSAIQPDTYTHTDATSGETVSNLSVKYQGSTGTELTKDVDYTVSYSNNTAISTEVGSPAAIILTGKGNFQGTKTIYFDIEASFSDDIIITVKNSQASAATSWATTYSKTFDNTATKPPVQAVQLGGNALTLTSSGSSDTGYYVLGWGSAIDMSATSASGIITGTDVTNVGTKYVVIAGTGNYAGKYAYATYKITQANLSKTKFNLTTSSKTYTGSEITLTDPDDYTITYTSGGSVVETLELGTDYTIAFSNNVNVSTAAAYTVTAVDGGNYTGTITGTFTIAAADLSTCTVTLPDSIKTSTGDYVMPYTGKALTPAVTVKLGGIAMGTSSDTCDNFKVTYANNTAVGTNTATVTVTGQGNLTGTTVLHFSITSKSIEDMTITVNSYSISYSSTNNRWECPQYNPTYTGKKRKPTVAVYDGAVSDENLISSSNYSTSYGANTNVSDDSYVTITGIGNFTGSIKVYFSIAQRDITADTVTKTYDTEVEYIAEGTLHKPTFTIIDTSSNLLVHPYTLVEDTDYTVTGDSAATTAGDNGGAGYTATVAGKGNYTGTIEYKYTVGHSLANVSVQLQNPVITTTTYYSTSGGATEVTSTNKDDPFQVSYIGSNLPTPVVTLGGSVLSTTKYTVTRASSKGGTDYTNSYNGTNTITVTLTGTDGYYGTFDFKYTVLPISFNNLTDSGTEGLIVSDSIGAGARTYTGSTYDITDTLSVKYIAGTFEETLTYNTDFRILDKDGNAKTTIGPDIGSVEANKVYLHGITTGNGNYTDSHYYQYVIKNGVLGGIVFDTSSGVVTYSACYEAKGDTNLYYWVSYSDTNPVDITKYVSVTNDAGTTLTAGTDYNLTVTAPSSGIGTATIVATGIGNYAGSTESPHTATSTYEIVAISADNLNVVVNGEYAYTGSQIKPTNLTVTYGGKTLTEGTDYEITGYGTNIYPGNYRGASTTYPNYVTVTGKGIYTGTKKAYFTIYVDLSDTVEVEDSSGNKHARVTVETSGSYVIGGSNYAATVKYYDLPNETYVTLNQTAATDEVNYTVAASTTEPGAGKIIVTGDHSGNNNVGYNSREVDANFVVDLSSTYGPSYVYLTKDEFAYTGSAINVLDYLHVLGTEGSDYTVTPSDDTYAKAGPQTLKITATTGSTYYKNSITLTYYVKYDLDTAVITFSGTHITYSEGIYYTTYTGSDVAFDVIVKCPDSSGIDIYDSSNTYVKATYTDIKNVGTHIIKIQNNNSDYVMGGPREITLVIQGLDISTATVTLSGTSFEYTGEFIKPTVTSVVYNGTSLTEGTDYTVSYANNQNVSATTTSTYVIITGKGAFEGSSKTDNYFQITQKDLNDCVITFDTAVYAGNGVAVTPTFKVTNGVQTLTEGVDYTITGWGNNEPLAGSSDWVSGDYVRQKTDADAPYVTITAVANGNYKNSKTDTFTIEKLDLRTASVDITKTSAEYTGEAQDISTILTLQVNGVDLIYNKDYQITITGVSGTTVTEKNDYAISIGGVYCCKSTVSKTFSITTRSIPGNWAENYSGDEWTGNSDKITITVGSVRELNTDPVVTITDGGVKGYSAENPKTLTYGTDYTFTCERNDSGGGGAWDTTTVQDSYNHYGIAADSPYVIITGMGNYSSEAIMVPFTVGIDLGELYANSKENPQVTPYLDYTRSGTYIAEFDYDGVSHIPTITNMTIHESDGSTTALTADDYTLTVADKITGEEDSISAGEKTVTIKGQGQYYGSFTDEYKINYRMLTGGITWTNDYTRESGNNTDITFVMSDDDMTVLTATESSAIYNTSIYAGWYYEEYGGSPIKPTLDITDAGLSDELTSKLIDPSDYNVTYGNNNAYYDPTLGLDSAPYAKITFDAVDETTGKPGNYYGSGTVIMVYFLVGKNDLAKNGFKVQYERESELKPLDYTFTYDGTYQKPAVVVSDNSSTALTQDVDYKVYYSAEWLGEEPTADQLAAVVTPRDPSKSYVYVQGIGSYTGILYRYFNIVAPMNLTEVCKLSADGKTVEYTGIKDQFQTGEPITPDFDVILYRVDKTESESAFITLTKDTDYTITVTSTDNYKSVGTVTLSAKSAYYTTPDKVENFNIKLDKDLVEITNYDSTYKYTGYKIEPEFKTNYDNISVTGVTYKRDDVVTTDLTSVGDIVAEVSWQSTSGDTGISNAEYAIIQRPISECSVVYSKTQRYTGSKITPSITVFLKTESIAGEAQVYSLTEGSDYTADYGNYISGTGTIGLTGSGSFSSSKTVNYAIALWPIVNLKRTASTESSISVSWVRDVYSDGTELTLLKMNSSGSYSTVKTVKVAGTATKYTFDGLEASTNYQIKARAYTDSGVFSTKYVSINASTEIATSGITVTASGNSSASVSWTDSGDVTVYYIYRDTNTTSTSDDTLVAVYPAANSPYTNTGLASGTYYYRVVGYYLNGSSELVEICKSDYESVTITN